MTRGDSCQSRSFTIPNATLRSSSCVAAHALQPGVWNISTFMSLHRRSNISPLQGSDDGAFFHRLRLVRAFCNQLIERL